MTVRIEKPAINVREELADLRKPSGVAGEAMLRAETPQEQFNLIGAGRRNLIINGAMQVAQRGTSVTGATSSGYSAIDRWSHNASGGTLDFSQQSFTVGQTDVPSQFKYFHRVTATTGNNNAGIRQRIEDVQSVPEGEVTLSFYAKGTNPPEGAFEIEVLQAFGSGGSATVIVSSESLTVTSSWQRFTYTITVPSLSGKTVGSGSYFQIYFRQPTSDTSTNTWTLDFTGVQLELGKVATPFEHRSYGEELALCQRYYQRWSGTGANQMVSTGVMYSGTACLTFLDFKGVMRAAPAVTASDTPIEMVVGGAVLAGTAIGFYSPTPWGCEVQITTSGGTTGHGAIARLESGGYLAVDAEL